MLDNYQKVTLEIYSGYYILQFIYLQQIAKAVSYCHANNICHRDLKPENFLLSSKDEDSPIKVIDFGLSCIYMEDDKRLNLSLKAGSVFYIAPEVLKGKYNELCDVWSLGVILFIMLSGLPPVFLIFDF